MASQQLFNVPHESYNDQISSANNKEISRRNSSMNKKYRTASSLALRVEDEATLCQCVPKKALLCEKEPEHEPKIHQEDMAFLVRG